MSRQTIFFTIAVIIVSLQLLASPLSPGTEWGLLNNVYDLSKQKDRLLRIKDISKGLFEYLEAVLLYKQEQGMHVVALEQKPYTMLEILSLYRERGIRIPYTNKDLNDIILDHQWVVNENKGDISCFAPIRPAAPLTQEKRDNLPALLTPKPTRPQELSPRERGLWLKSIQEAVPVETAATETDPIEEWPDKATKTHALPSTIFEKYLKPLKTIHRFKIINGKAIPIRSATTR